MVKFAALQSAKVSDPKAPKVQNDPLEDPMERPMEEKILLLMRNMPSCTYDSLAEMLQISRSTVKRTLKVLAEKGKIERVGGKRYGHWEIHER